MKLGQTQMEWVQYIIAMGAGSDNKLMFISFNTISDNKFDN